MGHLGLSESRCSNKIFGRKREQAAKEEEVSRGGGRGWVEAKMKKSKSKSKFCHCQRSIMGYSYLQAEELDTLPKEKHS